MKKNQVLRVAAVLLATAAFANAQAVSTSGPGAALWALARILLDGFGAAATIAFIYHALLGLFVDRDHFSKLSTCALFAGLGFGAYPIMMLIRNASITTF